MKTLIVENDVMTQCLLAKTLVERGHEVVSFENAEQAVLAYQREFYPVILVDAGLPGMDGMQFCRWVRSQPNGQRVYILIATAPGKPADLREVIDAGANDFIMRPLDTAALHVRLSVAEEQMKFFFNRKDLEESLQQNTDRLQQLLNLTSEAVWAMDASCRTTTVNPRLEELLGYDSEELNRHSVLDLSAEESCERVAEILARAAEGTESRAELVLRRKTGASCPVLAAVAPTPGGGGGSIWVLSDVSRLRANEGDLQRAQAEQERLGAELLREATQRQEIISQLNEAREDAERAHTQSQSAAAEWEEARKGFEAAADQARQESETQRQRAEDRQRELDSRVEALESEAKAEIEELKRQLKAESSTREELEQEFADARQQLAARRQEEARLGEQLRAEQASRAAAEESVMQVLRESDLARVNWEGKVAQLDKSLAEERERFESEVRSKAALERQHEEATERNRDATRKAEEQAGREQQRAEASEQESGRLRQEMAEAARAASAAVDQAREGAQKAQIEAESLRAEIGRINAESGARRDEMQGALVRAREELEEERKGHSQTRAALRQAEEGAQRAQFETEGLRAEIGRVNAESGARRDEMQGTLVRAREELEEERKGHSQTRAALRQAEEAVATRSREQGEEVLRLNQELNQAFEARRELQAAILAAREETAESIQKQNRALVAAGDDLRAAINARLRSEEASAGLLSESEARAASAVRERQDAVARLDAAAAEAATNREAASEANRKLEEERRRSAALERELCELRNDRDGCEKRLKAQKLEAGELSEQSQKEAARLKVQLDELTAERSTWTGRVEEIRQINRKLQEEISSARNETRSAAGLIQRIVDLRSARTWDEVARVLANTVREIVPWTAFRFDLHEPAANQTRPILVLSAASGEVSTRSDVPPLAHWTPVMQRAHSGGVQVARTDADEASKAAFASLSIDVAPGAALLCAPIKGESTEVAFVQFLTEGGWTQTPTQLRSIDEVSRFAAFALDRVAAAESQSRSNQRLATLSRLTAEVLWDWEIGSGQLWRNDAFQSVFGYGPEEVGSGVAFFEERLHPEDRERVMNGVRACLSKGQESWQASYRFRRADGSYAHVRDRGIVIRDPSGAPLRMVGAMVDASQSKEVEEAMIEGQARKGAILESAPDGIITIDHEGKVFEWNPTAERMFDYRRADVLGKPLVELIIPPGGRVRHQEEVTRHLADGGSAIVGRRLEFGACKADGSEFPVELSLSRIPTDGDPIYTGFIRDFTERRRAEQEIQKLAAFPRWNPNPVFEIAASGALTYCNDAARQMAAALGRSEPSALLPEGVGETVRECLREGQSKLRQETHVNGRVISWSFFPILSGGVVHCYASDITERVNLEQQLRHSQKMESVGQLAAGVAHDFNNLLSIIQGYSVSLQEEKWLPPDASEALNQIYSAAQRAAHLTRQLLTFSRRSTLHIQTLDLNDAISNVSKLLRRVLGENVELKLDLSAALPAVEADVGMMEQVVMNLALNARDAMPGGGTLRISTRPAEVSRSHAQHNPEASPGTHLCLEVRDTGSGMDAAIRERAFEPFFTTKPAGKGTGLGLATVYGIVKQHRGWIELESEVRQGTTFRIYLPASNKVPVPSSGKPPLQVSSTSQTASSRETILVVEDEPAVLAMAKGVLQKQGYRVIGAPSGDEAMPIWQQHSGEIDLLVTDVVMPGTINGRALAQKLQTGKPGLKVIYTSGYGTEILGPEAMSAQQCIFLPKPYHPDTLTQMVRECLGKRQLAAR